MCSYLYAFRYTYAYICTCTNKCLCVRLSHMGVSWWSGIYLLYMIVSGIRFQLRPSSYMNDPVYLSAHSSAYHIFFTMFLSAHHHEIFRPFHWQKWCPCIRFISGFKGHGHKGQNKFGPNLGVSGPQLQFEITVGYEMMHKAWSDIDDLPYCRLSFQFQCNTG